MIKLNIHQAKTHLSKYLEQLKKGEKIIICKHNNPIAEITPLESKRKNQKKSKRKIGLFKGQFKVPDSFFEPLDKDLLDLFN